MRLWQGVVLTFAVVTAFAACWLVRNVSAQQNSQTGMVAAAQPMPAPQPPFPVGPGGQPPFAGPAPGQPPVFGGPMPPFAPPPAAITANSDFVYLVWGNMLLQFDARTLKLLRRIPLRGEFLTEKPQKLAPPEKRKQEQPREEQTKRDQPSQ